MSSTATPADENCMKPASVFDSVTGDNIAGIDDDAPSKPKTLRFSPAESIRFISSRFLNKSSENYRSEGVDSGEMYGVTRPMSILRSPSTPGDVGTGPVDYSGRDGSRYRSAQSSFRGQGITEAEDGNGRGGRMGRQPWYRTFLPSRQQKKGSMDDQQNLVTPVIRPRTSVPSSGGSRSSFFSRISFGSRASSASRHDGTRRTSTGRGPAVGRGATTPRSVGGGGQPSSRCGIFLSRVRNVFLYPFRPSQRTVTLMSIIIKSYPWAVIMFFFTLLLLFGSPVQDLWCPKAADKTFDILFCIAIGVLLADIIMRSYISPSYFMFHICGMCGNRRASAADGTHMGGGGGCLPCIRIGSFMFWCDLVSTLSLFYDISWTNPFVFGVYRLEITLDDYGRPNQGLDDLTDSNGAEFQNVGVLAVIARTARLARFVRTSAVVKTSSKVNWYWIPEHLNPFFYIEACFRFMRRSSGPSDSDAASVGEASGGSHTGGRPAPTIRRGSFKSNTRDRRTSISRSSSSSRLASRYDEPGNGGVFRSVVGFLTCRMRSQREEARRDAAARVIQRAWRSSTGSMAVRALYKLGYYGNSVQAIDAKREEDDEDVGGPGEEKTSKKLSATASSIIPRTVKLSMKRSGSSASQTSRRRSESHVGSAMRELTGQRVALGIMIALILTVLFTFMEQDGTEPATMIILHNQTQNAIFADRAIEAARKSSVPDMFEYTFVNGTTQMYDIGMNPDNLRDREKVEITVTDFAGNSTVGFFSHREQVRGGALVELVSTIFILFIWFFGVTAFAGPIMTLVVVPIERMIRLLTMLMRDPLGYESSNRYTQFITEEDEYIKNTQWTKDMLKGMETSFLMSTILRIGSLLKVGFGSAGVEIIRNSLEKGRQKDTLFLNSQGTTVSCIFLFCDIRQFTDATECLQEEVFVFTNKIAAVVHSICNSYGGSANKNVGDAFLLSWRLDSVSSFQVGSERDNSFIEPFTIGGSLMKRRGSGRNNFQSNSDLMQAKQQQADKALYSVVKICIALHHDEYYVESMSETAREALLKKLSKRKGPVVQMGFGLHAGKAVQGAIGSQRKLDATYVSESVEMAEFLESSTKKYGVKMLMSDAFHNLLHPSNRRRCRKIDQIIIQNDEIDENEEFVDIYETGDIVELYTYDMDIDALWKTAHTTKADRAPPANTKDTTTDTEAVARPNVSAPDGVSGSRRDVSKNVKETAKPKAKVDANAKHHQARRRVSGLNFLGINKAIAGSIHGGDIGSNDAKEDSGAPSSTVEPGSPGSVAAGSPSEGGDDNGAPAELPELVLPSGPALYNAGVWVTPEMRKIRQLYSDGLFFQKFSSGLQSFYARDWDSARQCFQTILERFEDGPSRYFLNQIEKNHGVPPRNFLRYGIA